MEMRRNFEEIFKEVEKKTADIDRKIMESKLNRSKSSDKVVINKTYLASPNDKALKLTNYDKIELISERKQNKKANVLLPKIKKQQMEDFKKNKWEMIINQKVRNNKIIGNLN